MMSSLFSFCVFFFVFSSFFAASAGSEQGSLRVFQRISVLGVFLVFLNFAGLVYSLRSSNLKFIREWHKSFAFNPSDAQTPVAGCGAFARYTIAHDRPHGPARDSSLLSSNVRLPFHLVAYKRQYYGRYGKSGLRSVSFRCPSLIRVVFFVSSQQIAKEVSRLWILILAMIDHLHTVLDAALPYPHYLHHISCGGRRFIKPFW